MAPNEIQRRQDASMAAASAPAANNTLYLAIGVGVGAAIILAITGVAIRIVLKKKQHQRAVAELEHGAASAANSPSRNMEQLPRLVTGMSCNQMMSNSQQGWDALGSSETVHEPGTVANPNPKRLRSSVSLPKKFRNRGIQFGRNKYLSAIVELESPISEKPSPQLPQHETMEQLMASNMFTLDQINAAFAIPIPELIATDTARSYSPKPDMNPSFAVRSPARDHAAAVNEHDRPNRTTRSASAGVLGEYVIDGAIFGQVARNSYMLDHPELRVRSLSLGAPTTLPPSGPVPPIPIRSPARLLAEFSKPDEATRKAVCVSRMSSSSVDSASSSVLVTSPILTRSNDGDALHSPTLKDVVAEDEHASLKNGSNRQWQTPRITGPRPCASNSPPKKKMLGSVRGSILRFSSDSVLTRKLSSGSTSSDGSISGKRRISIAQLGTANSIVMSRVSSSNSLHGSVGGVQKVMTPTRKPKRKSSVSASGSPAERRRAGILRDISGNANKFSANRESSTSTLNSGRSSCGNPFQWDPSAATLNVPSALKGSPNARKGHRRQNCVRISTLTPQVLGPAARSRSTSPAAGGLMHRIKEERESDEFHLLESDQENSPQLKVQKRRPSPIRQGNTPTLQGNLRVQTLRASFTPDSPTLSGSDLKPDITTTALESTLSISPDGSRAGSRLSNRSSSGAFVIPNFPTPSKSRASPAVVNHDTPLPQCSMNFADDDDDQRRFALGSSPSSSEPSPVSPCSHSSPLSRISQVSPIAFQLPSSPPLQISDENKKKEYDPAWPVFNLPFPGENGSEYDPASPPTMMWDATDPERSSWFLPFAAGNMFDAKVEESHQNSKSAAAAREISPPCSPKSSPKVVDESPEVETLTSSNASRMLSLLPSTTTTTSSSSDNSSSSGALGLLSIPILLPPTTSSDPAYQLPEWKPPAAPTHTSAPRPRRVTSTGSPNRILRRRGAEPFLPTIPQSSSPPQAPPTFHKDDTIIRPLNIIPSAGIKKNNSSTSSGPKGPRPVPSKSVLNNISALRRMNSDAASHTPNRQSRNWQKLGREASPLLPWTGAVLPTEDSGSSLFDFDFGMRMEEVVVDMEGGAEEEEVGGSAMDEMGVVVEVEEGQKLPPSYKIHSAAEVTPRKSAETSCDPKLLMSSPTTTTGMATTPKSLYDADGFLK